MKNKKLKKLSGRWIFLLLVLLAYLATAIVNQDLAREAVVKFGETFVSVFKILIVVFAVMFLVNLLVKPEAIKKHLGKNSGFKGWIYTILGSIFVSGPPYVLFPFLGELRRHGVRNSLLVIFLNNRNVQPTFLPVMIFYFGTPFTVVVSIYILIFSSLNGWIVGRILEDELTT